MGYDKDGKIHNQYYSPEDRQEYWMHGSGSVRTSGMSVSNGLAATGTGVSLGGTMLLSTSVTNTTTCLDYSSYKSVHEGYSGCSGPRGMAGTPSSLGSPGIFAGQSKVSNAISYNNLSGLSNFSSSSRKPAQSSMGNTIKRK